MMKSKKEKWNTRVEMVSVFFISVSDNNKIWTYEELGSVKNLWGS